MMKISPTQMTLLTEEQFEPVTKERAGVVEQKPAEMKVYFTVYGRWTGTMVELNRAIFEALSNIPEIKEP